MAEEFLRSPGHTFANHNRNRLHVGRFFCYGDLHHASLAVEGLALIEDEVADAIIDGLPLILLDGL